MLHVLCCVQAWWEESIRVLGDFHFLDALLSFDKDAMTHAMTAQVWDKGL